MPVTDQQKFKLLILQARFLREKLSMHEQLEQEAMENFSKGFKNRLKGMPEEIQSFFKQEERAEAQPNDEVTSSESEPQQEGHNEESEASDQAQQDQPSEERQEIKRKEPPKRLKDVYKQIAKITHPDKLKGLSDLEKLEKEVLFKRAQRALSSGDYVELMDVALHLNVRFPDVVEEDTDHVKKKIIKIRNKIKKIEKSAAWQWYNANDKDKPSVMKDYIYYVYQNEMR